MNWACLPFRKRRPPVNVYKPFEMHTHTVNSDGSFTLEELCEAVKACGLEGCALTDHNTMSAFDGLPDIPVIHGIPVIKGIEWTTFYGHMLVLLADEFVDWRYARPETIDEYIRQVKAVNGIVGIAHPFEVGSPLCTGCHWDFQVKEWENVDYIEVWSKEEPTVQFDNVLAFQMWTDLLNRGYRIAITAGRDWHRVEEPRQHQAATYIGLRDGIVTPENVREAFRKGRTWITAGPAIGFSLAGRDARYEPGDTLIPGNYSADVVIDDRPRRDFWSRFGIIPHMVRVVMNGSPVCEFSCGGSGHFSKEIKTVPGWLRCELYGEAPGGSDKLIGCTSPVYVV